MQAEAARGNTAPSVPSASKAMLELPVFGRDSSEVLSSDAHPQEAPAPGGATFQPPLAQHAVSVPPQEPTVVVPPPQPPQLPAPPFFPGAASTTGGSAEPMDISQRAAPQVAPASETSALLLPASGRAVVAPASRGLPSVDRQRQLTQRTHSVTLAEYFIRRKGSIHPDDSFRIFCQVGTSHLARL